MSEPRWLTSEQMRAWRGYLGLVRVLDDRLSRDLQERSGLSMADYEILVRLSEAPERRLRMTELAQAAMVSKSRLSHQLTRMELRALVRREGCPSDGRGTFAVLTEQGYAALAAAAPGHVASVHEHLLDRLTPEQVSTLGDLSEAVLVHLPPPSVPRCPPGRAGREAVAENVPAERA
ncbi:MarR family transcriptional regulator [soil metagenome]